MARIIRSITVFSLVFLFLFSGLKTKGSAAVFRKGETEEKKIALTFDDGPSKRNTREILDILEQFNIHATFFVIGENAAKDPERVKSIFDAGHELGNHTYTHAYISKIGEDEVRREIEKTEQVLMEITGQKPRVFRPPGGYYNDASLEIVESMGYQSVLWSLDTRAHATYRQDDTDTAKRICRPCGTEPRAHPSSRFSR